MTQFLDHSIDLSHAGAHAQMTARMIDNGIFTFSVPTADAREELLRLTHVLGHIHPHPHAAADGVTVVLPKAERQIPGLLGFSRSNLGLHTDGSALAAPPDLVVNVCHQAAASGGETLLVDMKEVYQELRQRWPGVAQDLSNPGCMIFGLGRDQYAGAIFEYVSRSRIICRFRADGAGFADVRIGASMQILMDMLEKFCIRLKLESGQGYAINNGRWLHGRSAFTGNREFLRVLVNARDTASCRGFAG